MSPAMKPPTCWVCDVPLVDHAAAIAADRLWLGHLAGAVNLLADGGRAVAADAVADAIEVVKASMPMCRGLS